MSIKWYLRPRLVNMIGAVAGPGEIRLETRTALLSGNKFLIGKKWMP